MKQKDLALILVIVFISAIFSLVLSRSLIVSPKAKQQKAEVVQAVTADFPQPDRRFFNPDAFDPTKVITIGQNGNNDPFSATSH